MTNVLITGAASPGGIGRATARAFIEAGAHPILVDIDEAGLADARAKLGDAVTTHVADLSDAAAIAALVEQLDGVTLDALINNAARVERVPFDAMTPEKWRHLTSVNLDAAVELTRLCLPLLERSAAPSVVNLSSVMGGPWGWGQHVHYSAAKGALEAATRALAVELGPRGIRVNAIAPGFIATAQSTGAEQGGGADRLQSAARFIPLRRIGVPPEVAEVVTFLCSPGARYITGATLVVDGGLTLGDTFALFRLLDDAKGAE
ncbi:MAG: SDR family NAD(P)-dependent oxidoreductase [Deltaproteobacteria bacterium]